MYGFLRNGCANSIIVAYYSITSQGRSVVTVPMPQLIFSPMSLILCFTSARFQLKARCIILLALIPIYIETSFEWWPSMSRLEKRGDLGECSNWFYYTQHNQWRAGRRCMMWTGVQYYIGISETAIDYCSTVVRCHFLEKCMQLTQGSIFIRVSSNLSTLDPSPSPPLVTGQT